MHNKNSIINKTVLTILLGFAALAGFYVIANNTTQNIYDSLNDLSNPIEKLKKINQLTSEINTSKKLFEQLSKSGSINILNQFQQQSLKLLAITDSLKEKSDGNENQFLLIDSISKLIQERDNKLITFYRYEKSIGRKNYYENEISKIGDLLAADTSKSKMVIVYDKEKVKSTRIDTIQNEQKKGNIITRIFSKKKKIETKIVEEEATSLETDTILISENKKASIKAQQLLADITRSQQQKFTGLQARENEIRNFEIAFNEKVASLIINIENDLDNQTSNAQLSAGKAIQKNLSMIRLLFVILLGATIIMLYLIITDVSRNNRYKLMIEAAKEEADKQSLSKQAFLSNMSHEIRTPLQSIIGYSEQLKMDHEKTAYIDAIQKASEHLLNVVNEVLVYSSINSGKFIFENIEFDLMKVIKEVVEIVRFQTEKKKLDLNINGLSEEQIWLKGDAFRLKQILLNLLGNAIKYTDTGSISLNISAKKNQNDYEYQFTISDTGVGIPYELQDKIFGQFEQVSPDVEQRRSGTGLGLAITKALIEGQGGTISMKSTPGEGSHFTFSMVYQPSLAVTPEKESNKIASLPFDGEIWLVDDDKMILQLCSIILKKNNLRYKCFDSSNEMLQYQSEKAPSIAIMDIRMPGISGIDLCKAFRKKYGDSIHLTALTAHVLPEEKTNILNSGFDEVLNKPFREQELLSMIHRQQKNKEAESNTQALISEPIENIFELLEDEEGTLILQQFLKDTKYDLAQLQKASAENDTEVAIDTLHRLAGRTAQIGARDIGKKLRLCEVALRNKTEDVSTVDWDSINKKISELIESLEKRSGK